MSHVYAMIMAGGRGERFWPLSTSRKPKQLLNLFGDRSLLEDAVARIEPLIPPENVYVITNAEIVDATRAAVPGVPPDNIVGEPCGRDTAAACACGLALIRNRDPEGVICVLTADHVIEDHEVFLQTLREGAAVAAAEDVLLTIGIRPQFPSTGFGYIEAGDDHGHGGALRMRRALRFVEKPDRSTAEQYVAAGNYYWNAGMFIWSCRSLATALAKHRPPLAEMVERLEGVPAGESFIAALGEAYADLEKISVDYAIMEKADNIITIEGVFTWDDVGSWPALANHFPADDAGNVTRGDAEVLDGRNNIIVSQDRLTALIGVQDLVVVQAEGATLVCHRDRAQDVKAIVRRLSEGGAHDALL